MNKIKASTLVLYTTATCNLNCSYCYIDKNPALQKIDAVLDESFKGDYYFNFTKRMFPDRYQLEELQIWGGEPTLRLDRCFYTVDKLIGYYPNFSRVMFSSNFTGDYWMDMMYDFMQVFAKYPSRHFHISLQLSLDGTPEINDLGRGKGVTKLFMNNFVKMAKRLAAHDWIPTNVSITAFFKPTLSIETIPLLQTKSEIIRYYQFLERFKEIVFPYEDNNFSFELSIPNTACPSPHTKNDGILFANLCRLTREIEKENKNKHYFKFYEIITPFIPRNQLQNTGCANVCNPCGNCGMGTRNIGLLPWNKISLCHNGFVDLISSYKEMCLQDEDTKNHSIDSVLFKNKDIRETNCSIDDFNNFQNILYCYEDCGQTFQCTQLVAQIINLAKYDMIDKKYMNIKEACDAADFIQQSTSYCIRDNIGTSGSAIVTPIGLAKLLLNGAKEYILNE